MQNDDHRLAAPSDDNMTASPPPPYSLQEQNQEYQPDGCMHTSSSGNFHPDAHYDPPPPYSLIDTAVTSSGTVTPPVGIESGNGSASDPEVAGSSPAYDVVPEETSIQTSRIHIPDAPHAPYII